MEVQKARRRVSSASTTTGVPDQPDGKPGSTVGGSGFNGVSETNIPILYKPPKNCNVRFTGSLPDKPKLLDVLRDIPIPAHLLDLPLVDELKDRQEKALAWDRSASVPTTVHSERLQKEITDAAQAGKPTHLHSRPVLAYLVRLVETHPDEFVEAMTWLL